MTVTDNDARPAVTGTIPDDPAPTAIREWANAALTSVTEEPTRSQEQQRAPVADDTSRRLHAGGTMWRLRSLIAMGHNSTRIARAMNARPQSIRALVRGNVATVSPAFRELACQLWNAWWDKSPPERTRAERRAASAARRRAERNHWPCPLGLDEPDPATGDPGMDDPGYRPWRGWRPATGTGIAPDFRPPGPRQRAEEIA
jgi:septal ring-binding cell division protein DamX